MAEGLLRRKLAQARLDGELAVASAGVWTSDGRPATAYAVRAMAERGLDISTHASRNVTEDMVAQAALILTMTRSQAEALRLDWPACRGKTYLLSEMSGACHDVQDPIGGSLADYEATARELEHLIEAGFNRIVELAR